MSINDLKFLHFGSGNWSIEAQKKYFDVPTLIIYYQKGEKSNIWDEHPIYPC